MRFVELTMIAVIYLGIAALATLAFGGDFIDNLTLVIIGAVVTLTAKVRELS